MTTKTNKTAAKKTAAKKTAADKKVVKRAYDPEKAKARRNAMKAKKAEILTYEAKRTDLLENMARAAMAGELNADEIVALGAETRDKVAAIESMISSLRAASKSSGVRGFDKIGNSYNATFDGENADIAASVEAVAAEGGLFNWHVTVQANDNSWTDRVTGSSVELARAIIACRSCLNGSKKLTK